MMRFVIIALAMCQLCACAAIPSTPSQSSVDVLSSGSTDSSGKKTSFVYCGPLVCPSNANTCAVSKKTNADLSKIIIKRECKLGKEILLSESNEENNWSGASLSSYASTSIGTPSEEDQQRAIDALQQGFELSDQIQNSIRNHMANQFYNFPVFQRNMHHSPLFGSFSFNSPNSYWGFF